MKTLKETVEELKSRVAAILFEDWEQDDLADVCKAIDNAFEERLRYEEIEQQLSEKLSIYCGVPYPVLTDEFVTKLKEARKATSEEDIARYRSFWGEKLLQNKGVVKIDGKDI